MSLSSVRLPLVLLVAWVAGAAYGAELPIIVKARAQLGPDAALNAVQSIRYVGTISSLDPSDPKKQTSAGIEIIVQKPHEYRVTVTSAKIIDATGLDGYDGWNRRTAVGDPKRWQQTLQGSDQIKRLRANAWENIAFYRGAALEGVTVKDMGRTTVDGVACEKVAFIHDPNIIYYRYFAESNGRLVLSETESGGTIREEGEILVDGIKFPKKLISVAKNDQGKPQTVVITFDKITLNQKFPESVFAVPSLAND